MAGYLNFVTTYPPKAPARVALQRNTAIRVARSSGLYQNDMKNIMPGKIPASAAPRKNLKAATPAKLVVPAIPQQEAPKEKTRKPSHLGSNKLADDLDYGILITVTC